MRRAPAVGLVAAALGLAGCGASQKRTFVCPATRGHMIVTPFAGRIVALGNPPVEVRIDNRGDLRRGVVVLGLTSYHGWFALKTHFFSVRSYEGRFRARVRRLDQAGIARLGDAPPGGASLDFPPGPATNTISGWREWPSFTWMRTAGCYEWTISGRGFQESVVVRAKMP